MPVCKVCKEEHARLFNGMCSGCLTVASSNQEKKLMDKEHELTVELNTPFGADTAPLLDFFRHGYHKPDGLSESYIKHHLLMEREPEASKWEAIKDGVCTFVNKYKDQIISKQYEFGTINQYFANPGTNKVMIDRAGSIVIWMEDKD